MNWLAHFYLSEPTPAFRLGNLLPDLISAPALAALPPAFQPGIRCHRQIDAYTDAHPIFRRSLQRLGPSFRRYGGVLVDIFYDHILAREWDSWASQSLPEFAAEIYDSFDAQWSEIPAEARPRLESMRTTNWLCSYREIAGITEALARIGARLRRPVDLAPAAAILDQNYDLFREDFCNFFPQLVTQVSPSDHGSIRIPSRLVGPL